MRVGVDSLNCQRNTNLIGMLNCYLPNIHMIHVKLFKNTTDKLLMDFKISKIFGFLLLIV